MTASVRNMFNPEVMRIPVLQAPQDPIMNTLIICTGIAECLFEGRDTIVFPVPDENSSPLVIRPNLLLNSAATVALASISEVDNDQGTFAVDRVDITQSDTEEGQIFVNTDLFTSGGLRLNRVVFQVNLLVDPPEIRWPSWKRSLARLYPIGLFISHIEHFFPILIGDRGAEETTR
jgi:hypothetical protein